MSADRLPSPFRRVVVITATALFAVFFVLGFAVNTSSAQALTWDEWVAQTDQVVQEQADPNQLPNELDLGIVYETGGPGALGSAAIEDDTSTNWNSLSEASISSDPDGKVGVVEADLAGQVMGSQTESDKRSACYRGRNHVWAENIFGWKLMGLKHFVRWCREGHRITSVYPHTEAYLTTLGTATQWRKADGSKWSYYFGWNGYRHGGYAMTRKRSFERRIGTPFGDVVVGRTTLVSHIRLHYNGTYWRGH